MIALKITKSMFYFLQSTEHYYCPVIYKIWKSYLQRTLSVSFCLTANLQAIIFMFYVYIHCKLQCYILLYIHMYFKEMKRKNNFTTFNVLCFFKGLNFQLICPFL